MEEGLVDVRADFDGEGCGGRPVLGGYACVDDGGEGFFGGADVGLEETGVDLGEDVLYGFRFFG